MTSPVIASLTFIALPPCRRMRATPAAEGPGGTVPQMSALRTLEWTTAGAERSAGAPSQAVVDRRGNAGLHLPALAFQLHRAAFHDDLGTARRGFLVRARRGEVEHVAVALFG